VHQVVDIELKGGNVPRAIRYIHACLPASQGLNCLPEDWTRARCSESPTREEPVSPSTEYRCETGHEEL
jgi:hypothetical protein